MRAEPMNTMVSSIRYFAKRALGSTYSERIRSARASLLFRNSRFRYALTARRLRSAMPPSGLDRVAAVDGDRGAGDEVRRVAREEHGDAVEVVGRAPARCWR